MEDPDTVLLEMAAAPTPQPPATSAAPAPAASATTAPSAAAVMVGQPIETIGAPRQQQQPIPPPRGGQAAAAGSTGRGRPARISRQPIVFDLRDTIQ